MYSEGTMKLPFMQNITKEMLDYNGKAHRDGLMQWNMLAQQAQSFDYIRRG